ncbi:hypothetical protein Glove_109g91 [Diversispora epigaea]|uniref:Plasma membrane proteolipid 3 n=1 Tax=Diversispora epigaea TaxID=1348612 RepID=A0A397J8N9_9GLOM|nr:hypothetical protein Glove_109g91 [Diversispora epigaea]
MPFTPSDICKIIFAVILPPLGVFLERGCGVDLCINIALTILGYIPVILPPLGVFLERGCGVDLCINIALTILGYIPDDWCSTILQVEIDLQSSKDQILRLTVVP